jgi:phage-related protein
MLSLGDLVGAKVTRIRTFAKYIDYENFIDGVQPEGFSPNPNTELPRDIFFIERKSVENKNIIQFELSSIFDFEGIQLPGRLVLNSSCPFTYRGEGCLYEYKNRRVESVHGKSSESILPEKAPPVATENDESIEVLLEEANSNAVAYSDRGEYNTQMTYNLGDFVYIVHRNIKYYYVSKINNNTYTPPNSLYWIADTCSRRVKGCMLRWSESNFGTLPYGGFPCVNKAK